MKKMKPIRLEVKGLNSFIDKQVVEFDKLTERGLFGIFGPTGSGKSTILDGINPCFIWWYCKKKLKLYKY